MTDDQIITKLAKRMGWQMIYPYGGQLAIALRFEPNGREPAESATTFPDWLNSRDALAPVMNGLSVAEWQALHKILSERQGSEPFWGSKVTKFLLTLPPHDLARAIAEAIQEDAP